MKKIPTHIRVKPKTTEILDALKEKNKLKSYDQAISNLIRLCGKNTNIQEKISMEAERLISSIKPFLINEYGIDKTEEYCANVLLYFSYFYRTFQCAKDYGNGDHGYIPIHIFTNELKKLNTKINEEMEHIDKQAKEQLDDLQKAKSPHNDTLRRHGK